VDENRPILAEPPRTVLAVHGAGSGPGVFDAWLGLFSAARFVGPDLQEELDPARATMGDYVQRVERAAAGAESPLLLVGWSMGGLVAMMAAQSIRPDAIVLLEPSPPAEVAGLRPAVPIRRGTFDPEQLYGAFPPGVRARPESVVARSERARGISVPSLPCPTLLVSGAEFPEERGSTVAAFYGSHQASFPMLDHWDLVLRPEVRETVRRVMWA
jgi:pimeloyl-ACP methyl ester carboxylesterase